MILSIIICTYNRSAFLKQCLESILKQKLEGVEILVVDNNSADTTAVITQEYTTNYPNIRYVLEAKVGLSHARNRGIKEAISDWVLYLDDDTLAFPDLVERAVYLVERGDYDCVGGMYYAKFESTKPKWLPEDYGDYIFKENDMFECSPEMPHGCVVLYNRIEIEKLGGFNVNFGMNGEKTAYGEETELQMRIKEVGGKIGLDPKLLIYHYVRNDQTKLVWQLKSIYAYGRDGNSVFNYNLFHLVILNLRSLGGLFRRVLVNSSILFTNKNYYWQNFVLDSFRPNILLMGKMAGILNK